MAVEKENKINYIEIPVSNIVATKAFFFELFGWQFVDYGPTYSSFVNAGIDGGFFQAEISGFSSAGSPLIVFYAQDLEAIRDKIIALSGVVVKQIFDFPGGRRFHFTDPSNNEFAIWSDPLNS